MKAGLLGRKLGHSLSPQIHRFFGDYEYRLYEKEPEEVAEFLGAVFADGDFGFLNVTIPYKQTVFELCDELSPMARKLGNVNFVTRTADGRLLGDNTDAFGVERLIDSVSADVKGRNCAILGAGGAAMTVRAVLEERGAKRVTFIRLTAFAWTYRDMSRARQCWILSTIPRRRGLCVKPAPAAKPPRTDLSC